jgi:Flp pilus assembly protein TadD
MDALAERLQRGIAYKIGLIYGFVGMFDESVAELRRATELAPSNILARNDLALTFTMLGMYDEAKVEFEQVLQRDHENDVARRNLTYLP